jgi:hypothetical protein
MKFLKRKAIYLFTLLALLLISAAPLPAPQGQGLDTTPPDRVVKLIFIHHSTGENWLTDDYGDLGRTLDQNNYFVSDTNYGWGPNSIGDRTDIPNWIEWFSSGETDLYMQALVDENGQHSSYTRSLSDPGGENEIILFKSCFPNSALEGSPNDPPNSEGWLTVGYAKYVYNEILGYFANRPDKLFVVITAPPLSDPAYAANARAFNEWLMNDWLSEYPLSNVVVFDFYTVLTGADHHHRIVNGQIEHSFLPGANTLVYPSGDDHPSVEGSRKATREFVPLLNYYYHRWMENAAPGPITLPGNPPVEPPADLPPAQAGTPGWAAAFEAGEPAWEAFHDEATPTVMTCQPEAGAGRSGNALRLEFDIAANSWGTCAHFFDGPQDWSAAEGLTFYYLAGQAGLLFNVDLYAGSADNRETYLYTIEAVPESATDWVRVDLRWSDFHRASWEENAESPFAKPNQVLGMAFGFGTLPDTPNAGSLRVDDLTLLGSAPAPSPVQPTQAPAAVPETEEGSPTPRGRLLPCGGALVLPFALGSLATWRKRPGESKPATGI